MSAVSRLLFVLGVVTLVSAGCAEVARESEDPSVISPAEDAEDEVTGEAASAVVITTGLHGTSQKSKVKTGSVVSEYLAKQLSDNPNHNFWWFCGQAATATAINFARDTTPTDSEKTTQLQWIHDRLKALYTGAGYSVNDPAGPYAAKITWLSDLMKNEKSGEFVTTTLTTSDRETVKYNMTNALDNGAYVVALNQTSGGVGHYLTVYAIDYQPLKSGGGTVYYGDVLYNSLGTVDFSTFLDRMKAQSSMGLYNAFSVKKK